MEDQLFETITRARSSGKRILKVIHGRSGQTKIVARNWIFKSRKNFRGVIQGEEYDMFSKQVREMRNECSVFHDPDLGAQNSGITVIWLF